MADRTSNQMQPDEDEAVELRSKSEAMETGLDMSDPPGPPTTTFQGSLVPDALDHEIRKLKEEITYVTKEIIDGGAMIAITQNQNRLKILEEAQDQLIVLKTKLMKQLISYMDEQSAKRQRRLSSDYARQSDFVDGSSPEKNSIANDGLQIRRDMKELLAKRQCIVCPQVAPDSERLDILLPPVGTIEREELCFVSRESAMRTLLGVCIQNFIRRSKPVSAAGADPVVPLIDSLSGMGKTTFAQRFLAMVHRYRLELEKLYQMQKSKVTFWSFIRSRDPFRGVIEEDALNCLDELKQARTLHLKLAARSLFPAESRSATVLKLMQKSIQEQWGVSVHTSPDTVQHLAESVAQSTPIMIVFDEIGKAFRSPDGDVTNERAAFNSFVEETVIPLLETKGVYVLLTGRGKFLWYVALRPEPCLPADESLHASAAQYIRINLNPIRKHSIQTILKYTTHDGESCATHLAGEGEDGGAIDRANLMKLGAIAQTFYNETGGNPRAILLKLQGKRCVITGVMQTEAVYALRMFPEQIRWLFNNRNSVLDLTSPCPIMKGDAGSPDFNKRWPTMEYLATRVHAGIEGDDLSEASVYIPPPIESYLKLYLSELTEYLDAYSNLNLNVWIDKSRALEEVFLKWFQSVFADGSRSFDDLLTGFYPRGTSRFLSGTCWKLSSFKRLDGTLISALKTTPDATDGPSISITGFSRQLISFMDTGSVDTYFPGPKSASPDLFIIPPIHDLVIGVAVKCYMDSTKMNLVKVNEEISKFNLILKECQASKPKLRGVLLICSTSKFEGGSFDQLKHPSKKHMIFKTSNRHLEVIILNLSTKDLRKAFFGLAVNSEETRLRNAVVIETIIAS